MFVHVEWLWTVLHLDVVAVAASSSTSVATLRLVYRVGLRLSFLLALLQLAATRDEDWLKWSITLVHLNICDSF